MFEYLDDPAPPNPSGYLDDIVATGQYRVRRRQAVRTAALGLGAAMFVTVALARPGAGPTDEITNVAGQGGKGPTDSVAVGRKTTTTTEPDDSTTTSTSMREGRPTGSTSSVSRPGAGTGRSTTTGVGGATTPTTPTTLGGPGRLYGTLTRNATCVVGYGSTTTASTPTSEGQTTTTTVPCRLANRTLRFYNPPITSQSGRYYGGGQSPVATATTDAEGKYSVTLQSGTYSVYVETPEGPYCRQPNSTGYCSAKVTPGGSTQYNPFYDASNP